MEEGATDWTPHWNKGWALADKKDALVLRKEPWRDFFETLKAKTPNARVLDIGTGNLAVPLFAQGVWSGFDLHAIDKADIKPGQIAQSDRIQFRRGTAEQTGYPDEYFDAVTSRFGLEYTDLARSLPELSRLLRPGGPGLFLLHHTDSSFVQNARQLTVDGGVLPVALEAYQKAAAYLRNETGENLQLRVNAISRLREYLDDDNLKVRGEARAAYDNILAVLEIPHDEFQASLEILNGYIQETRFIVSTHRDLVKTALSPEAVADWTRRLTETGLGVDHFEPFPSEGPPTAWRLEFHKAPRLILPAAPYLNAAGAKESDFADKILADPYA